MVLLTSTPNFEDILNIEACASVLPYLRIILSAFSLSSSKPFFKKVRTAAAQKWDINKDICDCLH